MKERRQVAIYSPLSVDLLKGGESAAGGAEWQMLLLARALGASGIDTALVTYPLSGGRQDGDAKRFQVIERGAYAGDRRFLGKLAEWIHVWRAMSAADADVYLFPGSGPKLFVAALFCRLHRRKLVFVVISDLDFDFNRPDRGRMMLRVYRAGLVRSDLVVAQRWEQVDLARAAGLAPPKLIPSFAELAEPVSGPTEGLLWIGRLVDHKNPLAFLRLAEARPEASFRMVGIPTNETRPELLREVEEMAARLDNLELMGRVAREPLLEMLARSTLLVSTSVIEGMPNVFLEAWARGIPVVSLGYDPDGLIEELGLGLTAGGSEERLAQLTAELEGDPARRERLGANGREYLRRTHSAKAVTPLWLEALGPLLDRA